MPFLIMHEALEGDPCPPLGPDRYLRERMGVTEAQAVGKMYSGVKALIQVDNRVETIVLLGKQIISDVWKSLPVDSAKIFLSQCQ